jgi:hypothetical protein
MEKLFGGETAPARPAPPPAAQRQGRESALDTVEQAVRNARETERALRRDWEALQKMLDDVLGIFR